MPLRPAAVAGTWYPGRPDVLAAEVDRYLAIADSTVVGDVLALIAPHAGLMYSGPVAAHAYRLLQSRAFDVVALVGPSHFVGFEGVALWARGAFETPYGSVPIAEDVAATLADASRVVVDQPSAHKREHSIEMQLPFLARVLPNVPIVPLVMGHQSRRTIEALGGALTRALDGRRALIVASTDLSHYHDAPTAAKLDGRVIDLVKAFNPEGLLTALERFPDHACGGGPTVSVMMAARELGATGSAVLRYADSGDVSGDKSAVVGYLAAALGRFDQ